LLVLEELLGIEQLKDNRQRGDQMRPRFLSLLVFALFAAALLVTPVSAATSVYATGMGTPETISQTASGAFYVTDADSAGDIWNVAAAGGAASSLAQARYSLRGGLILPTSFGSVGGQFLVVGIGAASTMNTSTFAVSPYHSQANTVWTQPVLVPSFGSLSGDVLVTNQGSATTLGSVDYFTPSGGVGTLATFSSSAIIPFGAALAQSSFGEVGGPSLFVSDAGGTGIYTVDTVGNIKLFTTIPLGMGQSGLRQIAFAPGGWGRYSGDLFVSVNTRDIDVVNRDGVITGKISGTFNPRGLLFTTIAGKATLLFSNTAAGNILRAGPGDVIPVAS
jgi:hypothetical protein